MCLDADAFRRHLVRVRSARTGFVLGLVPPALLALLEGGPDLMLVVIVLYSSINVLIQSVIQPKLVGDAVGISASVTFLSLWCGPGPWDRSARCSPCR